MAQTLSHRGPDGEGVWTDEEAGLALAHRRLAIIDLSPSGAQPMTSACGRFVISYNGEIYNFRALKAALESEGQAPVWRGRSDTEVLLAAIAAWGLVRALQRANGMFAFALWDRAERTLVLARDRFGEKPLYYGRAGAGFVFGSELKALQACPRWQDPPLDRDALDHTVRYAYGPAERTVFRGILKVPPGCTVHVDRFGGAAAPAPYWSATEAARAAAAEPFGGNETEAAEAAEHRLAQAISLRREADVPLGVLLSGGIDSSAVTALMARAGATVRSFSIGFAERAFDESAHAEAVARHLGTVHTSLTATLEEARAIVPQLAEIYDEPFADSSQIPTHLVCKLARRHVTVALTGDGGDEVFGGYTRYAIAPALWGRLAGVPAGLRRAAARFARSGLAATTARLLARPLTGPGYAATSDRVGKALAVLDAAGPDALYDRLCTTWGADEMPVAGVAPSDAPPFSAGLLPQFPSFAERMMAADTVTYLPGDILTKVDRAAMAVSLEGRIPFLDPEVYAFAWSLPLPFKIGGGRGKRILRAVAARHIPTSVLDRPKQGFGVPIGSWLRGDLRPWAEALLASGRVRDDGLFDPGLVARTWAAHQSGAGDFAAQLWPLLMVNAWADAWRARGRQLAAP